MTTSISEFVEAHRSMDRKEAFRVFCADPQVAAALERTPDLANRLQGDFDRAWRTFSPAPGIAVAKDAAASPVAEVEELGALDDIEGLDDIEDLPEAEADDGESPLTSALAAGARYLCPGCGEHALEPRLAGNVAHARCPSCSWSTTDVLSLVPLKEAGALEYLFGGGAARIVVPAATAGGLTAAFLVLRWIRL